LKDQILNFGGREQIRIVRIDLAFDNEQMIKLFKERGQAIRHNDTEKIASIENKINSKRDNHYHTPIAGAFIIFEDDRNLKIVL